MKRQKSKGRKSVSSVATTSRKLEYQEPATTRGKNENAVKSCGSDGHASNANGNSSGSTNQGVQLDKLSLISKSKKTLRNESTASLVEKYCNLLNEQIVGAWTEELSELQKELVRRSDIGGSEHLKDLHALVIELRRRGRKTEALELFKADGRRKFDAWEDDTHLTWGSMMMFVKMYSLQDLHNEALQAAHEGCAFSHKAFGPKSEHSRKSQETVTLMALKAGRDVSESRPETTKEWIYWNNQTETPEASSLKSCDPVNIVQEQVQSDERRVANENQPGSLETSIGGKADHVQDPSGSGDQIEVAEAEESGTKGNEDQGDSANPENGDVNSSKVKAETLESFGAAVNDDISCSKDKGASAGSSGKKHHQTKRNKRLKKKSTEAVMQRYHDLLMEMEPWTDELKDYHRELIKRTDVDNSLIELLETIVLNLGLRGYKEKAVEVFKTYGRQKKYAWENEDHLTWGCYMMLVTIYAQEGLDDLALHFADEALSLSHDKFGHDSKHFADSKRRMSSLSPNTLPKRCCELLASGSSDPPKNTTSTKILLERSHDLATNQNSKKWTTELAELLEVLNKRQDVNDSVHQLLELVVIDLAKLGWHSQALELMKAYIQHKIVDPGYDANLLTYCSLMKLVPLYDLKKLTPQAISVAKQACDLSRAVYGPNSDEYFRARALKSMAEQPRSIPFPLFLFGGAGGGGRK